MGFSANADKSWQRQTFYRRVDICGGERRIDAIAKRGVQITEMSRRDPRSVRRAWWSIAPGPVRHRAHDDHGPGRVLRVATDGPGLDVGMRRKRAFDLATPHRAE
jgi:hypothetical protein